MCGSGCVMSNAIDMTKWMNFQLSGGKNEAGDQVMDPGALQHTHIAKNTRSFPKTPIAHLTETGYASGWRTGTYRGKV